MPRPKPDFEAVPVLLRLRPETLAALDAWAKANNLSRSEAVRHAITAVVQMGGLEATPAPANAKPAAKPKRAVERAPDGSLSINRLGHVLKGTRPVTGFDPVTNEPIYGPKR